MQAESLESTQLRSVRVAQAVIETISSVEQNVDKITKKSLKGFGYMCTTRYCLLFLLFEKPKI